MKAKHTTIHDRAKNKVVEDFAAPPPDVAAPILALALVVEPVHLCYLPRFMVAADECYSFGVPDLQCQQQKERFYTIKLPINEGS